MLSCANSLLALSSSMVYNFSMHWVHRRLFQSILGVYLWSMGIASSLAYTPPFEGQYKSGRMDGNDSYYPSYSKSGVWYDKMKTIWGSDLKVLEKLHPGCMVDSDGILFYIMMDMGAWFGGKSFYTCKITKDGIKTCSRLDVDNHMGDTYTWPGNSIKTIEDNTVFSNTAWISLAPCMAQEICGTTDYVHAVMYVMPSRWWNTSSGGDKEGLLLAKINKSNLSVAETTFNAYVVASKLGDCKNTIYNRNCFCAYHNAAGPNTKVLYLWKSTTGYDLAMMFTGLGSFAGMAVTGSGSMTTSLIMFSGVGTVNATCLEPRLISAGGNNWFMMSSGYEPWLANESPWACSLPAAYTGYFDTSSNTDAGCRYPHDFCMLSNDVCLILGMVKTSQLWAEPFASSYISWNISYVTLVLYSLNLATFSVAPATENCIAVFPVTTGTHGEAASTTTLYRNTYQFVAYNNHIIYAYCYPGKKTHLVLGVARYKLDSDSTVLLLTKREFVDNNGNSFGNFTDCSRIIFMDVKGSHLWIVFASVDNTKFYYFYISAEEVIKHAI